MPVEKKPLDFEVLPPKGQAPDKADLSRLIAWLLDDFIKIPGTNFRFGLDPIIGLIPGLGAGSSAVVSSVILLQALRSGVPRIVLVRMALNVVVNSLLDAVPFVGDFCSAFYKSNRRNIELLDRHSGTAARGSHTADWIFVVALIAGLIALAVAVSAVAIFLVYQLGKALQAA